MQEIGRTEVILEGTGQLEEAHELVDVRLETADLDWAWEGPGLVAEGAIRAYIYFQKEDGTVEGEGVEIPFHAVVAPPGSGPDEVQVRLASVREDHRFDPQDRSFSQTIRVELVAEAEVPGAPPAVEGRPAPPAAVQAEPAPGSAGFPGAPEEAAVPPEAGAPSPLDGAQAEPAAPPAAGAVEAPGESPEPPGAAPEPLPREPLPEPALVAPTRTGERPGGPGLQGAPESGPGAGMLDDSVIVWKPFPEE